MAESYVLMGSWAEGQSDSLDGLWMEGWGPGCWGACSGKKRDRRKIKVADLMHVEIYFGCIRHR